MQHEVVRWILLLVVLMAGTARAADAVDVAVVLLSDVSRSVDDSEFALEKQGYTDALRNPRVIEAIRDGAAGGIALAYAEFAGPEDVKTVLDWHIIRTDADARAFAHELQQARRTAWGRTAIGSGIDLASGLLARIPAAATKRVIDVAGDGTSNAGRNVREARDAAVAKGITINGLAIVNEHPGNWTYAHVQPPGGLPAWYRANVVGGPGSFVIEIKSFRSFKDAMLRKLLSEIAQR